MENRIYYYARVSTKEQNLDRQLTAFKALGASERDIITDKESGKNLDRAGYQALKTTMLRAGDTLVVKSLDRLSRNKGDIKAELQYFKEHGIRVKIIDLPTTMTDFPTGQEWVLEMINNILIEVLGTIAEQERATIQRRFDMIVSFARHKKTCCTILVDIGNHNRLDICLCCHHDALSVSALVSDQAPVIVNPAFIHPWLGKTAQML